MRERHERGPLALAGGLGRGAPRPDPAAVAASVYSERGEAAPPLPPEVVLTTQPQATSDTLERRRQLAVGAALIVLAAIVAAYGVRGHDRPQTIVPVAIVGLAGLIYLATRRFTYFVVAILVLRASIDAIKLSAGSIDATGAISVLFIVVGLVWLIVQRASGEAQEPSPVASLLPPLVAVFLTGAISVAASLHPVDSAIEAIRIGTVAVIVAILARVAMDRDDANLLLGAVFASAVVPLAVAARQMLQGGQFVTYGGFSRVRGTFSHPNPFAAYLFLIITLAVAVVPHLTWRWRIPVLVLTVGSGVALIGTYTRSAWGAVVIALFVIGILQDRRIIAGLVVAFVVGILFVPSISARFSDLGTSIKPSGAAGNSLIWRFEYWQQVLDLQRNPITGIGLDEVKQLEEQGKQSHNDLIRIYVETGLLGLAAYGWLTVALVIAARKALRDAEPGLPRGLAVAFAAALTGLLVMTFVANVISQLVILWYFAAIGTLAIVSSRRVPVDA